jgi:hypothetical protein
VRWKLAVSKIKTGSKSEPPSHLASKYYEHCEPATTTEKTEVDIPAPEVIKKNSIVTSHRKELAIPVNPINGRKLTINIGCILLIACFVLLLSYFTLGKAFTNLLIKTLIGSIYEMPLFATLGVLVAIGAIFRKRLGRYSSATLTGGSFGTMVWLAIHEGVGRPSLPIAILVGLMVFLLTLGEKASRRSGGERELTPNEARFRFVLSKVAPWPVLLFGAYVLYSGAAWIDLAIESESWQVAEGVVQKSYVGSRLSTTSSPSSMPIQNRYTSTSVLHGPVINYQFLVNGQSYSGNRFSFAPKSESSDPAYAEAIVKQYSKGAVIKVYYRPGDPSYSVIQPGMAEGSWFLPGFGIVTILIGILMFVFI